MNLTCTPVAHPGLASHAIRVFLADDHQITLWGLRRLIDSSRPQMEVVGMATSRAGLLGSEEAANADVVLLDLDLGGEDSAESLGELRQRCRGRVLVLTAADDIARHRLAVMKGARGVVHKSEPADVVLRAIQKVHDGEVWMHRSLLGEVFDLLTTGEPSVASRARNPHAQRIASLTPREREIITAMVHHAGAKQFALADELGMSEHTLRNHLTSVYSKLGVHGRLELHVYASEHGLCKAAHSSAA